MSYAAYLPFLVQIVLAAGITGGVIALSQFLGQRAPHSKIKDAAYECGILSDGSTHTRFPVKFYVTAMLFILFDIEVIFLYPVAVQLRAFGPFALGETIVFIALLFVAFIYV
ncbi:MAG: NADH-quinone oxidoreductase subunit A, partial [Gammaproteobacteria bacterium]|nr:NADH-quinone oxidoreductase subunit A [Gammaproteobacteria bacterium]